jgi:hypothetical protein
LISLVTVCDNYYCNNELKLNLMPFSLSMLAPRLKMLVAATLDQPLTSEKLNSLPAEKFFQKC